MLTFVNLPNTVQKQVLSYLERKNFFSAKELFEKELYKNSFRLEISHSKQKIKFTDLATAVSADLAIHNPI